jgi:hypothetical protein
MISNQSNGLNFIWTARGRFLLCLLNIGAACLLLFSNGPQVYNDYGFQLSASDNLLEGNGISIAYVKQVTALDEWTYAPLSWWPPGHTIAVTMFLSVTGDIWWAAYCVETLYIILFFIAWYFIIELFPLQIKPHIQTGIWLVWLLLFSPLMSGTNQGALSFYSLSLLGLLLLIRHPRYAFWSGLFCGASVIATCFIRYAYLPLVVVYPLTVAGLFWTMRDRRLIAAFIVYAGVVGCGLLMLTAFGQRGGATPLGMNVNYEWAQLGNIYPFPAVIVGGNNLEYLVNRYNLPSSLFWAIAWLLSVALIVLLIRATWKSYHKSNPESSTQIDRAFWAHGWLTIGLVYASLAYLSVKNTPHDGFWTDFQGGSWTFLREMRYFAPTWGYFVIALAIFVSESWPVSFFRKPLRIFVIAVFSLCLLLQGALRVVNFYTLIKKLPLAGGQSRIVQPTYTVLKNAGQADSPVVYMTCGLYDMDAHKAEVALAGAAFYEGPFSPVMTLNARDPVTVVIGLPHQESAECFAPFTTWIERYDAIDIGSMSDTFTFYSFKLPEATRSDSNQ